MNRIMIGDVVFNQTNRTVTCISSDGTSQQTKLSDAEKNILKYLFEHPNQYISKETLISIGWENRPVGSNSLPVAIANLRKIKNNNAFKIENLTKVGYVLTFQEGLKIDSQLSHETSLPQKKETEPVTPVDERTEFSSSTHIQEKTKNNFNSEYKIRYVIFCLIYFIITLSFTTYLYINWIYVSCESSDVNVLICYTDTPPKEPSHPPKNEIKIIAKSGSVEESLVIRKP